MIRDWSITQKIRVLTVSAVVLGLAVAAGALAWHESYAMRQARVDQLLSVGRTLAHNCSDALASQDATAADQLLTALESTPAVLQAHLVGRDGKLLAEFGGEKREESADSRTLHPLTTKEQYEFLDNGRVLVAIPVRDSSGTDNHHGTLTLIADAPGLASSSQSGFVIITGALALALLVSCLPLLILHRAISQPILKLAETATAISDNEDYSIRLRRESQDEIGIMYRAFNRLLDQVQQSELEIRQTQNELIEAKEEAVFANRAKSDFLANMSHEIRSPLTGILGFTDLLLAEQTAPVERRTEYLQTIRHSGNHLLNLINDVLDLSKIESGKLVPECVVCQPHQIISEVVSLLRAKAVEKDLSLDYHWTTRVPVTIETDPGRLRQLMMNLIGNAIKFTRSGGVEVTAAVRCDDDSESRPLLHIDVADSGVGIAYEKVDEIFEPFVQADASVTRRFGGTGLGLAICQQFAVMLGGDLAVTSEVGSGTTFHLSIDPGDLDTVEFVRADAADAMLVTEEVPETDPANLDGARILLVEDGETNRRYISLALTRAGATVDAAENGQVGVDKAMTDPYDLILMDMQMPVMDGFTATRMLRDVGFRAPIVALTANAMTGDREKCIAAGCTDFLTKPIHYEQLIAAIALQISDQLEGRQSGSKAHAASQAVCSRLPCEEDLEFQEIVEEFVVALRDKLSLIEQALTSNDLSEVAFLAHWLKGSGGTAGFSEFTAPATELEKAARDRDRLRSCQHFESIREVASRISLPWKKVAPVA